MLMRVESPFGEKPRVIVKKSLIMEALDEFNYTNIPYILINVVDDTIGYGIEDGINPYSVDAVFALTRDDLEADYKKWSLLGIRKDWNEFLKHEAEKIAKELMKEDENAPYQIVRVEDDI
ncbi:hypothetical protein [Thermoplasma sp. Kam2015]|uniref:hypothetical protein n=1 Tax=Thermoplasma sp. Kam2015 TaxID=2094122 RepID=UPI001293E8B0|nr:hypothetical protein [Thermoplasma sp. Kam2015]